MTTRQRLLIFVIAGVLGLGSVAAVIFVTIQQMKTVQREAPLSEADKRLVITARDIERLGGPAAEPDEEDWSSRRQMDGSRFILYLYKSESEPSIFIYSRAFALPHALGARQMYQMDKVTAKLGHGDEKWIAAPALFPGRDDSSAWFIEQGGKRIGNFFLLREGRFVLSAKITGITFDNPAEVETLFSPILTESRRRSR